MSEDKAQRGSALREHGDKIYGTYEYRCLEFMKASIFGFGNVFFFGNGFLLWQLLHLSAMFSS